MAPPEILTVDEVRRLIGATGRGVTGIRNRALVVVFYRCALRVSEALSLAPADLELELGRVFVRNGKGGRKRVVGIDAEAAEFVRSWMGERSRFTDPSRGWVFCTLQGKQMQTSYVRQLMPRLAARAGITRRVHAHGLRHTLAVELDRERTPLRTISQALGHANVATTAVYLDHLEPRAVLDKMTTGRASFASVPTEGGRARHRARTSTDDSTTSTETRALNRRPGKPRTANEASTEQTKPGARRVRTRRAPRTS